MAPVDIEERPALNASDVVIPDGLCGVGGCVFIEGHEQRGQISHTWQA